MLRVPYVLHVYCVSVSEVCLVWGVSMLWVRVLGVCSVSECVLCVLCVLIVHYVCICVHMESFRLGHLDTKSAWVEGAFRELHPDSFP